MPVLADACHCGCMHNCTAIAAACKTAQPQHTWHLRNRAACCMSCCSSHAASQVADAPRPAPARAPVTPWPAPAPAPAPAPQEPTQQGSSSCISHCRSLYPSSWIGGTPCGVNAGRCCCTGEAWWCTAARGFKSVGMLLTIQCCHHPLHAHSLFLLHVAGRTGACWIGYSWDSC